MMGWWAGTGGGWMVVMMIGWILVIGLGVWAVVALTRNERGGPNQGGPVGRERPDEILDRRLAAGEIDQEKYRELRGALHDHKV